MGNPLDKDCIFISEQCKYSQALLKELDTCKIKDHFTIISIHNTKFRMPKFVDRVPLLYRVKDRVVIVDDALDEYMEQLKKQFRATQKPIELLAGFSDLQTSGRFGDNFGFIEDDKQILNTSYGYLNDMGNNGLDVANALKPEDTSKPAKFDQHEYDKYLSERDKDITEIFNSRPKPI